MATIVILAGNPSATSRTAGVLDLLALRLTSHGHKVRVVLLRELPLVHGIRGLCNILARMDGGAGDLDALQLVLIERRGVVRNGE